MRRASGTSSGTKSSTNAWGVVQLAFLTLLIVLGVQQTNKLGVGREGIEKKEEGSCEGGGK